MATGRPRAEKVVSFARRLGQSPIEALIAAGYIHPDEVQGVIEVAPSRSQMTDEELLRELRKRLAERPPRSQTDDITRRLTRPDHPGHAVQNHKRLL